MLFMTLEEIRSALASLGYGKKLPDATYISRPDLSGTLISIFAEVRRAEIAAQPREDWNLLKIHTREYGVTFLSYPDFDSDPHPVLVHSTKINLNSGRVVRTDGRAKFRL